MVTYILFKSQNMLLSERSRKGLPDSNLHTVQNPEHEPRRQAKWWLTYCSKHRPCPCQWQAGRANLMLTYTLFKAKACLVSNNHEGPPKCWLTNCSNPRACSSQQQAKGGSQMLTYSLFKTQSILLSGTSRKDKLDADLQPVEDPEHAPVRNKQERPVRCWLTACSKHRACSCQQEAGRASQILTYSLFTFQSMLLSASEDKPMQNLDLNSVYNQSPFLLASIWDKLAVGLHPV